MKKIYKIMLVILVVLVLLVAAVIAMRRRASPAGDVLGGGPFRLKVSDPEYTALLDGEKTVEARLDRPPFNRLAAGDPVVVVRSRPAGDTSEYPGGKYKYDAEVVRVDKYKGIDALLKGEGVAKVYPGKTAAEAAARFGVYLPPGTGASEPVIAIELRAASGAKKAAPKKKAPKKASERANSFADYGDYDDYEL